MIAAEVWRHQSGVNLANILPLLILLAVLQQDATTDVDVSTTPAEAAPLDPRPGPPRSIEDLISRIAPETPASEPAPTPRSGPAPITVGTPAFIDDRQIAPDGPLSERDMAYQNRLLGSFRSAQGAQGVLDGRWMVTTTTGVPLYSLQLADPGAGEGRIEGAWRDLRRTGPGASGFIDAVVRDGEDIIIRFIEADPAAPTEVRISGAPMGLAWAGSTRLDGQSAPVIMSRSAGVELAARDAPYVEPEPTPPAPKAQARPAPKRAKATKSRPRAAQSRARATAKSRCQGSRCSASKTPAPKIRR